MRLPVDREFALRTQEGWPPETEKGLFDKDHFQNWFAWCFEWRTHVASYSQLTMGNGWELYRNLPNGHYALQLMERRAIFCEGRLVWRSLAEQEVPWFGGNGKHQYYLFSFDPGTAAEYACRKSYVAQKEAEGAAKRLSAMTGHEYLVLSCFGYLDMY